MNSDFSGGPESVTARITRWLRPGGGSVSDGVRLAAINTAGLVVAVLWVALVSLVARLLDSVLPVPVLLAGLVAVLVAVAVGVVIWYQYGTAHGNAARSIGADPRADVFGAIGAVPFIVIAAALLSIALLGLFFATITFSGARLAEALRQLGFAVLFLGIAAGSLLTIRSASGGMSRGT